MIQQPSLSWRRVTTPTDRQTITGCPAGACHRAGHFGPDPLAGHDNRRSLHRTLVVEFVLVVLDDERDGMQLVAAVGGLGGVLQVEILDRDVVVAEPEIAAYRLE